MSAERASAGWPTEGRSGPREVVELASGWRFCFEPPARAVEPNFDDEHWQRIVVPHSWNRADATEHHGYRRGVGVYRLRFHAPAGRPGSLSYLEFDGANLVTTAWLNGRELGTHCGGYSRFRFEVTSALEPATENLLTVRVDSARREDVPPLAGDFTMFGGLYRPVRLLRVAESSLDLMDLGGPGVYLSSALSAGQAALSAKVRVRNARSAPRQTRVVVKVFGPAGALEAEAHLQHLAAAGVSVAELALDVPEPKLWRGLSDPALYSVVTELYDDEELLDALDQPHGFRSVRVDPERGFLLNDEPYPLRGVCLHQDREGFGWVVDRQGLVDDFRILAELGATFLRVVHYQSHPLLYELCDRVGLVVWAEHALLNQTAAGAAFSERALLQMSELIRQNFNRPSVAFWGVSNEMQTREPPEARALLEQLVSSSKREDPSRLCTLATNFGEAAGSYGEDMTGHNKYLGWYGGELDDFPAWLDAQRAKAPLVPLGVAEYGAGAGPTLHYDEPRRMDHSEEYQCLYHEASWRALRERPWLACTSVWVLFDFASAERAEGERLGINDKGLVTRDRKLKKDAFFFYKAQWSREPFVYITSRRFVARTRAKTEVKVYSNLPFVELLHNGRSLGRRAVEAGVALWREVELTPWANEMVASAGDVKDSVVWILNVFHNPWATPESGV